MHKDTSLGDGDGNCATRATPLHGTSSALRSTATSSSATTCVSDANIAPDKSGNKSTDVNHSVSSLFSPSQPRLRRVSAASALSTVALGVRSGTAMHKSPRELETLRRVTVAAAYTSNTTPSASSEVSQTRCDAVRCQDDVGDNGSATVSSETKYALSIASASAASSMDKSKLLRCAAHIAPAHGVRVSGFGASVDDVHLREVHGNDKAQSIRPPSPPPMLPAARIVSLNGSIVSTPDVALSPKRSFVRRVFSRPSMHMHDTSKAIHDNSNSHSNTHAAQTDRSDGMASNYDEVRADVVATPMSESRKAVMYETYKQLQRDVIRNMAPREQLLCRHSHAAEGASASSAVSPTASPMKQVSHARISYENHHVADAIGHSNNSIDNSSSKNSAPETVLFGADVTDGSVKRDDRHDLKADDENMRTSEHAKEVARLAMLQQYHHDMQVIRNGGHEAVRPGTKSSASLANSLVKMRERSSLERHGSSMYRRQGSFCLLSDPNANAMQHQKDSVYAATSSISDQRHVLNASNSSFYQTPGEEMTMMSRDGNEARSGTCMGHDTMVSFNQRVRTAWGLQSAARNDHNDGAGKQPVLVRRPSSRVTSTGVTVTSVGAGGMTAIPATLIVDLEQDDDDDSSSVSSSSSSHKLSGRKDATTTKSGSLYQPQPLVKRFDDEDDEDMMFSFAQHRRESLRRMGSSQHIRLGDNASRLCGSNAVGTATAIEMSSQVGIHTSSTSKAGSLSCGSTRASPNHSNSTDRVADSEGTTRIAVPQAGAPDEKKGFCLLASSDKSDVSSKLIANDHNPTKGSLTLYTKHNDRNETTGSVVVDGDDTVCAAFDAKTNTLRTCNENSSHESDGNSDDDSPVVKTSGF